MTESFEDIPRLYTAIAEWLALLVYIRLNRHRMGEARFWVLSLCFLLVQIAFLVLTDNVPIYLWIPCMVVAVLLMFRFICTCCDISPVTSGYFCVRAAILAEFAAALEWQLHYFIRLQLGWDGLISDTLLLILVYGIVFGFMFFLERKRRDNYQRLTITKKELLSVVAIGLGVFLMSNLSYVYTNTPFSGQFAMDIFNTRTLVDLGGVTILFAYHVQRSELHMKYELDAINNVLQNQFVQYQQSRESIEIVGRKYHDLKHLIAALRNEPDPAKRAAWIDEIESDIQDYELLTQTGNKVLDTVLMGKRVTCRQYGISLTMVVDGGLLDFMHVMDICSVFGNALDNAIECVREIENTEKRLIHVSVSRQKGFLMILFENYCERRFEFQDALPATTKPDAVYHGFGLKSIQSTVQKYNGTITIQTKDNWWELKVLIPLQKG